ncbi:phosphate/phosphite/phosphonate ABC transporter substrate-binding protein [Halalkalibacter urbisdiaboli]|uniref:phosphate/phosphite/phosphonate ABC transporter substrate-binding protein n=1 Tax=Halalkalibacter urbisdiaboli TaxID=1960589 RepID=UPI000B440353|nr:phosphate/phosphite/phosphonate ABC transporter substrate-binding protein [Halalkalibacter urbisdiaboli]
MKKWLIMFGLSFALTACGSGEPETSENIEPPAEEEIPAEEATENDEVFEVAVIPSQTVGEMETGLNNLEAHLSEQLNREVKVESYPNYNAVVEAINYNHIDLAFLGPLTYVIAHEQSGAQAILTQEIDDSPYYYSYIITHQDNEWENLEGLLEDSADVNFAFASISSTSGHLMPGLHLRNLGYYDDETNHKFNQIQFAGSHDVVATLVKEKNVDAGAIDSAILNELMEQDKTLEESIKVLWESDKLYQYPWVVPAQMDEEEIKNIQEAFYEITDEEILRIFGGASKFVEADDAKYAEVLEAAREFNMLSLE